MNAQEELGRGQSGLRRKALTLSSGLALIALLVGALFGDRGVLHLLEQRKKVHALQREIEALRVENIRLATEISGLRDEASSIEVLAREQLGLALPGETVYLLRPTEPPPSP